MKQITSMYVAAAISILTFIGAPTSTGEPIQEKKEDEQPKVEKEFPSAIPTEIVVPTEDEQKPTVTPAPAEAPEQPTQPPQPPAQPQPEQPAQPTQPPQPAQPPQPEQPEQPVQKAEPRQASPQRKSITVNATFYDAMCAEGCTGITATGLDVRSTIYKDGMRIIAVDPSIIPLGSIVYVELSDGSAFKAIAADTGGAIKGHRIDVLVSSDDEARQLGRQTATITFL